MNTARTSGLGLSIALIAVGATLKWAVTADAEGINLNTVGLILFVVGIIGAIISLGMFLMQNEQTATARPAPEREVVTERPVATERETRVERDVQ